MRSVSLIVRVWYPAVYHDIIRACRPSVCIEALCITRYHTVSWLGPLNGHVFTPCQGRLLWPNIAILDVIRELFYLSPEGLKNQSTEHVRDISGVGVRTRMEIIRRGTEVYLYTWYTSRVDCSKHLENNNTTNKSNSSSNMLGRWIDSERHCPEPG